MLRLKRTVFVLLFLFLVVTLASKQASQASQASAGAVTFYKNVLPILQKNCQSCHRPGQIGPMPLLTYKEARPWTKAIKEAVLLKKMPPWFADPKYGHFNNDRSLKPAEIETLVAWTDGGAAEGDPKDAPAPVQWPADGWQIQPDAIVEVPPYPVPAHGVKEWEQLAIPSPFKEDTWVTSVEILPGQPSVVHHYCFNFEKHKPTTLYNVYEWMEVPRDEDGVSKNRSRGVDTKEGIVLRREVGSTKEARHQGRQTIRGGNEFCYLPGLPYEDYRPVNAGVFVPAGTDIVVSMHYTPNGVDMIDRTRIGLTVAKVPPKKRFLPQDGEDGENPPIVKRHPIRDLAIPPNERSYLGPPAEITFLKDLELVWFRPHAHMRATSVQYKLTYPDGREEIVLNVPRYDFNWQLTYRTSLKIPKGSRMRVEFRYDNSANNKYNPDPNKWVYYGDQSWEEMGSPNIGFLVDR
jgi:mono/diheme cytochrome c family protein